MCGGVQPAGNASNDNWLWRLMKLAYTQVSLRYFRARHAIASTDPNTDPCYSSSRHR